MDMKLELVPMPVTDVDRAKIFYTERLGFVLDVDIEPSLGVRIVQLTPPGSACSILLSTGLAELSTWPPAPSRACTWWCVILATPAAS